MTFEVAVGGLQEPTESSYLSGINSHRKLHLSAFLGLLESLFGTKLAELQEQQEKGPKRQERGQERVKRAQETETEVSAFNDLGGDACVLQALAEGALVAVVELAKAAAASIGTFF